MAAFLLALALIGGAKVLEIHSPKRYKRTEARLAFLAKLNQAQTATQRIGLTLQKEAISAQALMWSEQLTENQLAFYAAKAMTIFYVIKIHLIYRTTHEKNTDFSLNFNRTFYCNRLRR